MTHRGLLALADHHLCIGGECRRIRLVGNDTQGTGLRAVAVQRALRTGQCLDALDVNHAGFRIDRKLRKRLFVDIQRRRRGGDERAGVIRDAAENDLVRTGDAADVAHARQHADGIFQVEQTLVLEIVPGQRLDTAANVLEAFLALARRYRDLLDAGTAGTVFLRSCYVGVAGDGHRYRNCQGTLYRHAVRSCNFSHLITPVGFTGLQRLYVSESTTIFCPDTTNGR